MSAPEEVQRLAGERAAAREARDFARADELRDAIAALGWSVVDAPGGFTLQPLATEAPHEADDAKDVPSLLDLDVLYDVALHWVCEGWPEDIDRAIRAFRANAGGRGLQFVVADVTGDALPRFAEDDDVEVVRLTAGTGWAAARNAGLRRSRAPVVIALDGSVEPTGDVLAPIERALADPSVGVCGPFGLVTRDLREFHEATGPGPCDAVEGYLMAFRRDVLVEVGGFDERFKWYRTADIEWSFRILDAGYHCRVVEVPVTKHVHRAWAAATEEQRAAWSKRNFYRFLDRFRDRWDLVLAGEPAEHGPGGGPERPTASPDGG